VGNFHRAHQAVYVEDLLEKGNLQWGIAGVSLRSAGVRDALAPQDYIYTLALLGEQTKYRIIGALKNIVVAPETPQAVLDYLANPKTQIVSSTITEKGYYLSSGEVDFEQPALKAEAESLTSPSTIYGFLAKGLIKRCKATPDAKLTIMCCDNISGGGELLAQGVKTLLGKHDKAALAWTESHVSFISSMVDRVSPATDDALVETIAQATDRRDAAPVSAEHFSQWIIEENFAGARPDFDKVGADFAESIVPFERMKLGYLNAGHTLVSTLGYLSGDEYVHEALRHPDILQFMRQTLYENVLPYAGMPKGYDGPSYIAAVVDRFQNASLPYANLQVGTDSSQKIQQRWFPTLNLALGQENESPYFAFCLAAWFVFIETALQKGVLNDPKKSDFEQVTETNIAKKLRAFLTLCNAENHAFFTQLAFITAIEGHVQNIQTHGIKVALRNFLDGSHS
jgi:fructuronate reductase